MLWIALYLAGLPLQIAQRGMEVEHPLVVSDGPQNRLFVLAVNQSARGLGVKAGMPLAAATALAADLKISAREPARESAALHSVACWASQFTPSIVLQPPESLLLEVSSTLTLHRGLSSLLGRLRRGMDELGYRASAGIAPTPLAAWLFAKARYHGYGIAACTELAHLEAPLQTLSLRLFDWPIDLLQTLATLGVLRIDDCLKLPRDGFIQRFGEALLRDLDKARGFIPDPRSYFTLPERYASAIDFGFEVTDAMALLFPLKRLLVELEGFLRARGAGVHEWNLAILHSKTQTQITIATAAPERDAERLTMLARERIARIQLPAGVNGIRVDANRFFSLELQSDSWLPDPYLQSTGWTQLIDKLISRLGTDKVYRLVSRDDHRPECAWQKVPAVAQEKSSAVPMPMQPRPLSLLSMPRALLTNEHQPLCQGPLELIAGPERIEAGWWDGRPISRDYYVARNRCGETLWIYREHRDTDRWYLHGYFC